MSSGFVLKPYGDGVHDQLQQRLRHVYTNGHDEAGDLVTLKSQIVHWVDAR